MINMHIITSHTAETNSLAIKGEVTCIQSVTCFTRASARSASAVMLVAAAAAAVHTWKVLRF